MIGRTTSALLLVLAGCGTPEEGVSSSDEPSTGIDVPGTDSSESSSSSEGGESSSSSGDAAGDPNYPRPTPVDELGDCPEGFLGPITFDGTGWGCIPACDAEGQCPEAQTGEALGECATNPQSSATPCMDSNDCTVEGEMCGNAGMEMMACLLPPSHCILRCETGEACPADMTCSVGIGICQYIP